MQVNARSIAWHSSQRFDIGDAAAGIEIDDCYSCSGWALMMDREAIAGDRYGDDFGARRQFDGNFAARRCQR